LRGEPHSPRQFFFDQEQFQEIVLDDFADAEVPPSEEFRSVELVLTEKNQAARTAAIKAREQRLRSR
jgi:hypothetical protein